jgi:hypothetical protein
MLALLLLAMNDWAPFERRLLDAADRRAPRVAAFLRATGPGRGDAGVASASWPPRVARRLGASVREAAAVYLAVSVTWTVWDENPIPERWLGETTAPEAIRRTAELLQLPGGWRMFAPDVPSYDLRVVVDAVRPGGEHVDPLTGHPPDFDALSHGPWDLHYFWQTYEYWLATRNDRGLWLALMRYVRRVPEIESWEGPRRFESVEIWVLSVHRPDYGQPVTPRRLALAARWPAGDAKEGAEPAPAALIPSALER